MSSSGGGKPGRGLFDFGNKNRKIRFKTGGKGVFGGKKMDERLTHTEILKHLLDGKDLKTLNF